MRRNISALAAKFVTWRINGRTMKFFTEQRISKRLTTEKTTEERDCRTPAGVVI